MNSCKKCSFKSWRNPCPECGWDVWAKEFATNDEKSRIILKKKCVTGCKRFEGGEIKHHKGCDFYPDSLSKRYDELEKQKQQLEEALILIHKEFNDEENGNKPSCVECDAPNGCCCTNNIITTTLEKIKQKPIKEILEAYNEIDRD